MSRVGKQPIKIPQEVNIDIKEDGTINVKGPKGNLERVFKQNNLNFEIKEDRIYITKKNNHSNTAAMWGTTRALLNNMILGVSEGFEKKLELHGVGYKMAVQGKKLVLNLGFSHPVEKEIPAGLEVTIDKNVLSITGLDKQSVGQFAAEIRILRKVEPYKGKGFRYEGEQYIKKEGKKAVASE